MTCCHVRRKETTIDRDQLPAVLIVDDQPPFRAVARTVAQLAFAGADIVEVETGEDAVERAETHGATLVLMDINLPGISGLEATRRIVDARPGTVVILMSTYDVGSLPADAATCGAARYVHKEDLSPTVLREIWSSGDAQSDLPAPEA